MNINDLVTQYVSFRRTLGERCQTNENILRSFCRAVGLRTNIKKVHLKEVAKFLAGTGPLTRAWHARYFALKGFFHFVISRGHLDAAPLPTEVPKRPPTLAPYIYSHAEIRRLLDAIPSYQPFPGQMEGPTLRTILLVLYGAGLRRGEVLNLSITDVDLPNALLTIRNTKFSKSRLAPVSTDLVKVLGGYASWRGAHPPAGPDTTFFVNRRGETIQRWTLDDAFRRLREHAGVRRSDGGRYQPRLHDLRHSAARRIMPTRLAPVT